MPNPFVRLPWAHSLAGVRNLVFEVNMSQFYVYIVALATYYLYGDHQ